MRRARKWQCRAIGWTTHVRCLRWSAPSVYPPRAGYLCGTHEDRTVTRDGKLYTLSQGWRGPDGTLRPGYCYLGLDVEPMPCVRTGP